LDDLTSIIDDMATETTPDKEFLTVLFRQFARETVMPAIGDNIDNLNDLFDENLLTGIANEALKLQKQFNSLRGLINDIDFDTFFKERLREQYGTTLKRLKPDDIADDKADDFVEAFIDEMFKTTVEYSRKIDTAIDDAGEKGISPAEVLGALDQLAKKNGDAINAVPQKSFSRTFEEFKVSVLQKKNRRLR
jgi:hypothetical protein